MDEPDWPWLRAQAWAALCAANQRLFRCHHELVRVVEQDDGTVRREKLTRQRLPYELADAAAWRRGRSLGPPPMNEVRDLRADPRPRLPGSARLGEVPVFLGDGRLPQDDYYPASGVLCLPAAELRDLARLS